MVKYADEDQRAGNVAENDVRSAIEDSTDTYIGHHF